MGMLDRLYRSSEKDIASGGVVVRRFLEILGIGNTAAAVTITVVGSIAPPDTVRLIQTVLFVWAPGAAQFPVRAELQITDPTTATQLAVVGSSPLYLPAAATFTDLTLTGVQLIQMQGEQLQVIGVFNAGVALNQIVCYISGLEFPRGQLRR
jgi:hypothetical protein